MRQSIYATFKAVAARFITDSSPEADYVFAFVSAEGEHAHIMAYDSKSVSPPFAFVQMVVHSLEGENVSPALLAAHIVNAHHVSMGEFQTALQEVRKSGWHKIQG